MLLTSKWWSKCSLSLTGNKTLILGEKGSQQQTPARPSFRFSLIWSCPCGTRVACPHIVLFVILKRIIGQGRERRRSGRRSAHRHTDRGKVWVGAFKSKSSRFGVGCWSNPRYFAFTPTAGRISLDRLVEHALRNGSHERP